MILGFTCIALANSRPYFSSESAQLILRAGIENTAALLEELGLNSKAIYFPSSTRDGKSQAVIPFNREGESVLLKGKMTGRLIVRYGNEPEDVGIAVTTPGSISLSQLQKKPGTTPEEIESAITYMLVGFLDIANTVKVNLSETHILVEVTGAKLNYENTWYYRCLGSPVASIIATIICEALNKPVRIVDETILKQTSRIVIEVLS